MKGGRGKGWNGIEFERASQRERERERERDKARDFQKFQEGLKDILF